MAEFINPPAATPETLAKVVAENDEAVKPSPVPRESAAPEPFEPQTADDIRQAADADEAPAPPVPTTSPELQAEIYRTRFRLFIDALRSDRFTQTFGALAHVDVNGVCRHCALGVAIEVAIANGLTTVTRRIDQNNGGVFYDEQTEFMAAPIAYYSSLPPTVAEWYGLDYPYAGSIPVDGMDLDYWNDSRKSTFAEIAVMIARTYVDPPAVHEDGPTDEDEPDEVTS